MKGEERKKRKKVKEIHINHNVWKKYHKGYMKHIIIIKKKNIYKLKKKKKKKLTQRNLKVPKWRTTGSK